MDDRRFDALTKTLGTTRSRRGLARLLGGLSLVGALTGLGVDEAAAGRRIGGAACTRDRQCKTGNCLRNDTCSCSRKHPTCKPPTNPCKTVTCNFSTKRCVTRNKTDGVSCGSNQTCCGGTCTPGLLNPEGGSCPGDASTCCPGLKCTPFDNTCCRSEHICHKLCCLNGTRCTDDPDYLCCASGNSCNRVCCPRATDICTPADNTCCPPNRVCGRACCTRDQFCKDRVECRSIVIGS